MEKDDKGSTMIRMGVSGWMFLLVPAYPGCPGSKAVKRSLLLLLSKVNGLETVLQPACYDSVSRTKQFTLLMRSSVSRLQMTPRTIFLLVLLTQYCWCKSACCVFLTVGMFSFFRIFYFRQFYFLLYVYTVCFVLYLHCLWGEYTSLYNVIGFDRIVRAAGSM